MTTPVIGIIVALLVIVAIYFLFVVPGERRYHETKLRLMQERIERRERAARGGQIPSTPPKAPENRPDGSPPDSI